MPDTFTSLVVPTVPEPAVPGHHDLEPDIPKTNALEDNALGSNAARP